MESKMQLALSEADRTAVNEAIAVLSNTLGPQLRTLIPSERRTLPKMGDGTEPFVLKAMEYAKSNPEFLPPFVSVEALELDVKAVATLNNLVRPLRQLVDSLEDSIMLAGSEAYTASLSYYNSVKQGLKMSAPGAESIYNDLKQRFEKQGQKATQPPTTPEQVN